MRKEERELLRFEEFRKTPEDYPPLALLFYALGLSNNDLVELLGIYKTQLSSYMTGRSYPTVKIAKRIQAIARYYGIAITLDEMFRDVDETEVNNRKSRAWYDEIKAEAGIGDRIPIRRFEEVVRERGFSTAGEWLRSGGGLSAGVKGGDEEEVTDSDEPGDAL